MWTHSVPAFVVMLGSLGTILLVGSCSGDTPTSVEETRSSTEQASDARLSVCHRSGNTSAIITTSPSALAAHLGHGDYRTDLTVSHASDQPNDGTHFHRIGDALAAAQAGRLARKELRTAACRITITVGAGMFRGTNLASTDGSLEHFPLEVSVPAITLRGALVMQSDASGRATGSSVTHRATTLAPIEPLSDLSDSPPWLIVVAQDASGSAGNGFTVEGFALRSGWTAGTDASGTAVVAMQVRDLAIRGNRIESGFFVALDLQESRAIVERNHISGTGLCDMCLAGPGAYRITGNRILAGALEGILIAPAIFSTAAASEVSAAIINNEIRDHRRLPAGAAIRIGAIGLGSPDVRGSSHITIRDNLLVNNNFAMMFEASFPEPDTRLRGDIEVTIGDNVLRRSCQADLLVAFARHTTGLELTDGPYLRNSTYRLTLPETLRFRDAWVSNPAGFGNTLLVNGRRIAHGSRQFFDWETCPATGLAASIALNGAH